MHVRRLDIESYGAFAGERGRTALEFSPGLNVVLGPNESGKSTLLACILDLLFPARKPERERYAPWARPELHAAAAELVTSDGRAYRLARRFSGADRFVELQPRDTEVPADTTERAVQRLLESELGVVDRSVFLRTCCITQDDIAPFTGRRARDEDLVQALEAALTGGERGITVSGAVAAIEKRLDELRRQSGKRRERELESLEAERAAASAVLEAAQADRQQLASLARRAEEAGREAWELDMRVITLRRTLEREQDRAQMSDDLERCNARLTELGHALDGIQEAKSRRGVARQALEALPPECEAWVERRDEILAIAERLAACARERSALEDRAVASRALIAELDAAYEGLLAQLPAATAAAAAALRAEAQAVRAQEAEAERLANAFEASRVVEQLEAEVAQMRTQYNEARAAGAELVAAQQQLSELPASAANDPSIEAQALGRERGVAAARQAREEAATALQLARAFNVSRALRSRLGRMGLALAGVLVIATAAVAQTVPTALLALAAIAAALVAAQVVAWAVRVRRSRAVLRAAADHLAVYEGDARALCEAVGCAELSEIVEAAAQARELQRHIAELGATYRALTRSAPLEDLAAALAEKTRELENARQVAQEGSIPLAQHEANGALSEARRARALAEDRLLRFLEQAGLTEEDLDCLDTGPADPQALESLTTLRAEIQDVQQRRADAEAALSDVLTSLARLEAQQAPDAALRVTILADLGAEQDLADVIETLDRYASARAAEHGALAALALLQTWHTEEELRAEYRDLAAYRVGLEERLGAMAGREPLGAHEHTELEVEIERAERRRDALRQDEATARGQAEAVSSRLRDTAGLHERIDELGWRIETARRRIRALETALDALRRASEAVQADLSRPVREHAQAVFLRLTHDRYVGLSSSEGDGIALAADAPDRAGVTPEYLSRGTREQLYFAVRYAFARVLAGPERRPLLLLDDPFVNFDRERASAAMRFLAETAAEHQTILATCDERAADKLPPEATVIRL